MRYIRTKDGKIYELQKTRSGEKYLVKTNELIPLWNTKAYEVIKQADTIEELCDEFVYKRTLSTGKVIYETFERLDREHHADDEFCRLIEYRGDDYPDRQGIALEQVKNGVYGAIWTDKGLIYVAKMNKKGELELL